MDESNSQNPAPNKQDETGQPNEVVEDSSAQPVDVTPPSQPAPGAQPQASRQDGLTIEEPASDSGTLSDAPPPTTDVPAAENASAFDMASGLSLEDDTGHEEAPEQTAATEPDETEINAEVRQAQDAAAALSLADDDTQGEDIASSKADVADTGQPAPMSQPIPKGLGVENTDDGPAEYEYKIHGQPEFAMVTVQLPANRRIKLEAAAMVSMDTNVVMRTRAKGGFRRMISGNSLFMNEFIAEQFPATITFANGMPGDIRQHFLNGNEPFYLSSGAFLACGDNIKLHTEYQGMAKGLFSSTGLFMTQCEGKGSVFFNSYGGILEIDVKDEYMVDNDHIVGYTGGLQQELVKFGGYKSLLFSGEGLVSKFTGQGKLWIQTRKIPKFTSWLGRYRRSGKGINLNQIKSMLGK